MPEPNQAIKHAQPRPILGPSSVPKVGSDYILSTGGSLGWWFDLIVELGQIGGKKFRVFIRLTKTNVLIVCTRANSAMISKGPGHYPLIAYWGRLTRSKGWDSTRLGRGKAAKTLEWRGVWAWEKSKLVFVPLCPKHPTETTKREGASVTQSSVIFQSVMMV